MSRVDINILKPRYLTTSAGNLTPGRLYVSSGGEPVTGGQGGIAIYLRSGTILKTGGIFDMLPDGSTICLTQQE